jgi:phosphoribosylglycinamide formyltransferase-1
VSSGAKANLAILASGAGSNADKICSYFETHPDISVSLIISNRSKAGVLQIASAHGIESLVITRSEWVYGDIILPLFAEKEITHIILAGFLLLVPEWLVESYRGRILNIHPALLPLYGGKGMYGMHVHRAVKDAGELISGITIHEVDEHYDQGDVVFQKAMRIDPEDSAEEIAHKVLQMEHHYYPRVIEEWVKKKKPVLIS